MQQAFFYSIPLPLFVVCLNEYKVIKTNPAFDRLFTHALEAGTSVDHIFSGLTASALIKNQVHQLLQKEKVQRQGLLLHRNKQQEQALAVWLEVFALPESATLKGDNLAYVAVMTVCPDVPLLEDAHFNALFDSLPDHVFFKDAQRRYLTCNNSFKVLMGEERDYLRGKTVEQTFQARVSPQITQMENQLFAEKVPVQQNCITKYPTGVNIAEDVLKAPYFGPQGQVLGLVAVSRNIEQWSEELKQAQVNESLLMAVNQAVQVLLTDKPEKFDENLYNALKLIGVSADVTRVCVWQSNQSICAGHSGLEGLALKQVSEWCNNVPAISDVALVKNMPYSMASNWFHMLLDDKSIHSHLADMPEGLRPRLKSQGICSILAVPIFLENKFWGFIGFDECRRERSWSNAEESILRAAGCAIAAAIQQLSISRALRRSESTFCNIIYATNEVIWEVDTNLHIKSVSGRVEDVFGPDFKPVSGDCFELFFKNAQECKELFEQVIFPQVEETGIFSSVIHQLKSSKGELFWFTSSGAGIYDDAQNLIGLRGVSLNITSEVKAKQELEQTIVALKQANEEIENYAATVKELAFEANAASRAKSDFLTNIGHEVRTPINIINGMSYLALQSGLNSKQQAYVNKIKDAGNSLLNILTDILDFASRDNGGFVLNKEHFDVAKLLRSIVDSLHPQVGSKDIDVNLQISPEVPQILVGDKARITQVFTNIIGNAIKFTEAGKVNILCLVTERKQNYLTFYSVISDTGIGMPENAYKSVFEPFLQLELSDSRRFGGAGMGLAVARRLVTSMGGEIWIESKEGEGTQVFFTLKLEYEADQQQKSISLKQELHGAEIRKIEITQDESCLEVEEFEELAPANKQKSGELEKLSEAKLQLLEDLLVGDDAQALVLVEELAPAMQSIDEELATGIEQTIAVFDYSTALELLCELKKRI